jgi:hypothetical protein
MAAAIRTRAVRLAHHAAERCHKQQRKNKPGGEGTEVHD